MPNGNVAIRIENISKCYQIYDHPSDRLKQMILPRLQCLVNRNSQSRYFKEFYALKNVSLEIKKGETVGIIGKNGAGKSTLLQIICQTLTPTTGEITIDGRVAALLELGSGFNPEFTGRENVLLNAALLGLNKHEIEDRFDDIAAFADIGSFIEQPVKTYSSGMIVRLAFAVITNVDADILVIDEALSVGDAFFVQKCMRFLRDFMEKGTVLFVSHDAGAVINLCHRAVLMKNGVAALIGSPKLVSEAYLAALYNEVQIGATETADDADTMPAEKDIDYSDMRLKYINSTAHRNDIELFKFKPAAAWFGKRGASLDSVVLSDEAGLPLSWIVGGETVNLIIVHKAHKSLHRPIVGFFVKDRLGQYLFGDNTFLSYRLKPLSVESGQQFQTKFCFRMPFLPVGDYSIDIAVSEGTQEDHVQQNWIHDVLVFKSHSSSACNGLIGIPMRDIKMAIFKK